MHPISLEAGSDDGSEVSEVEDNVSPGMNIIFIRLYAGIRDVESPFLPIFSLLSLLSLSLYVS